MLCESIQDFFYDVDPGDLDFDEDLFMVTFQIESKSHIENLIIVNYFAVTSLSTVGFGDFHPRGDTERLVTALILLFGVAIFSYIMGIFIGILDQISHFNEGLDDGDNLSKFFGILRKFNNNT